MAYEKKELMNIQDLPTYQRCARCVMDTSDQDIYFNDLGFCNHCEDFVTNAEKNWFPNAVGAEILTNTVNKIKKYGAKKEYDCILGLSGGLDSSFLALKAKEFGLRPLVVHVDGGWNSELAVSNIQSLVDYCGFDLHTDVVDWEEMQDLQLAYLKSGIPNQDVPQDHAFFASLYRYAVKNNIKYILSGGNTATEGIYPTSWEGSAMDAINLRDIFRKFGAKKLKTYKTISFFQYYIWFPFFMRMRTVRPLNFMPYDKQIALKALQEKVDYKSYGRKHGESQFTKIFQNYYLPKKFGYDKRIPHYSSLIMSGQMSRNEAVEQLSEPLYGESDLTRDIEYLCKKLDINLDAFHILMDVPNKVHSDFKTWSKYHGIAKKVQKFCQKFSGKRLRIYS